MNKIFFINYLYMNTSNASTTAAPSGFPAKQSQVSPEERGALNLGKLTAKDVEYIQLEALRNTYRTRLEKQIFNPNKMPINEVSTKFVVPKVPVTVANFQDNLDMAAYRRDIEPATRGWTHKILYGN